MTDRIPDPSGRWRDVVLAGPVWRTTLRLGLPAALALVAHAAINLVDLLLVGRFGEDAVAGVHVATAINFLPMLAGNGISVASLSLLSRRLGAGDLGGARALAWRTQLWMLALGVLIGTAGGLLAVPSVDLFQVTGPARGIGIEYLQISQYGTVTMFALMQTTAVMRAAGEIVVPVLLLFAANLLNLLLDLLLMFGWDAAGVPALGPAGAAWATVASRLLAAFAGYAWLLRRRHPLRLHDRSEPWLRDFVPTLWLALPQTLQMLVRALLVVVVSAVAAAPDRDGAMAALTALGVTTRLDSTVLFATLGFATAATTVVGHLVGAGRQHDARRAARCAALYATIFAFGSVLLLASFADAWIRLFVVDPGADVLAEGRRYLWVAAWQHLPAAFCIAIAGAINGAGRMVAPMLLDLAGFAGLLLPALFVAHRFRAPLSTVWLLLVCGQLLLAVAYTLFVERSRWTEPPPLPTGRLPA